MQFNVEWLKQWVAIDLAPLELAERLTAAGLEVDSVRAVAADFTDVVVAEIADCRPHPAADKLSLCSVNDGGGERLQIVCGAPNARAGIRVPLARVGASIGADFKIKRAKLRGVESFGMLCSAQELGLSDDHSGLFELPADAPIGANLRDYLGLDDAMIEVDLTPNRGDCLSIRGLARDVAASCRAEYTGRAIEAVPAAIEDRFPIRLDSPTDCARYAGRVIRGIDPAARTPLWMAEALRRCGLRSISPVVDVTNYVLLELGQPMHAFDLGKLHGEIVVRRGRTGEKLRLLDESEVDLDPEVLAICDSRGPVALAGIMGGLDSGVGAATTDILFESAWFRPATIMGKARAFGLQTDAAHRFERGVDPAGQEAAVERATALLIGIAGGQPGPLLLAEDRDHVPRNRAVTLRHDRLESVLGFAIPPQEVEGILARLGMTVVPGDGQWAVTAPSNRFDIEIEEDLIEEVARIHGYDAIPEAPVTGEVAVGSAGGHRVSPDRLRQELCALGYQEAVNYSFIDRKLLAAVHQDDHVLPLANPLSADLDAMRTTLLPGLVAALGRNLRRQQGRVRLFETGVVFLQRAKLDEIDHVAAVAGGDALPEQWGVPARPLDFFDVKGDVERLLSLQGSGQAAVFEPATLAWLHPGASAIITVQDAVVGWCGAVHPAVLKALDIGKPVFGFELDLEPILRRDVPFAKEISRFPSVRRDLALVLPNDVRYDQVRSCVAEAAGPLLEKVVVFDVYLGGNLTKGYKSLAIGLIFNDVSSTLRDEDVDSLVEAVVSGLGQRLGARLRG
jgi:phenylalanyl-tRNA synthetase beta chain